MANKISHHDKLFKITMEHPETTKEFLENYLPIEIKSLIDMSTLRIQKDSFIDESFNGYCADLLYSVNFEKSQGYIYILFEHLSNPDAMIAFRLLKYAINIMDSHLKKKKKNKLPLVYPVVIYTGHKKYYSAESIFDLFEGDKILAQKIFLEPYKLVNLQNITDAELQDQIWFGLMAKIFKNIHADPIEIIREIKIHLIKIDKYGGVDLIYSVIKYLSETRDVKSKEKFFQEIATNLSEKTEGKIMTLAQRLRDEGMQQGMQQGIELGILKGREEISKTIAYNMLKNGESIEKIAGLIGLSTEEIKLLLGS